MRSRNCFLDKSFYSSAIHTLSLQNKADESGMIFETMLRCAHLPNTFTYNSMISAYYYAGKIDDASRLLDGMVFDGAFPDSVTYNTILQALIKARKMEEAVGIFLEMTRNEFDPDSDSYTMALVVKDLGIASMIWKHKSSNQERNHAQAAVAAPRWSSTRNISLHLRFNAARFTQHALQHSLQLQFYYKIIILLLCCCSNIQSPEIAEAPNSGSQTRGRERKP